MFPNVSKERQDQLLEVVDRYDNYEMGLYYGALVELQNGTFTNREYIALLLNIQKIISEYRRTNVKTVNNIEELFKDLYL